MKNVVVSAHTVAIDAHIVRGLLEAEGIPAYVQDDQYITMNWMMSHALGGVKVTVPESFREQALTVLEKAESDEYHLNQLDESSLGPEQVEHYIPEERLYCPKCGSDKVIRLDWFQHLSLVLMLLAHIPLAFSKRYYSCDNCTHVFAPDENLFKRLTRCFFFVITVLLAMFMVFALALNSFSPSSFNSSASYMLLPADNNTEVWVDTEEWPEEPYSTQEE